MDVTAYAASIGHSIWFSHDLGESWNRAATPTGGIYNESRCWSLSVHQERQGEVLAGTDIGVYRWNYLHEHWSYISSPMDDLHIQQIAQAPHNPDIIFAGTRPAEIFRSVNGGTTWDRCQIGNSTECWFINTPRVTSIHFDPVERETIWITIEIDGIFKTTDLGETWEKFNQGLTSDDTHNLAFFDFPDGTRKILCSTEEGLHVSRDDGANWSYHNIPQAPWLYMRCIKKKADDSGVMFLSVGDKPSGVTGMLFRSRDYGETWEDAKLPTPVNSTIWWIATNRADPGLIFCHTIMGQIFRSKDGGETWEKLERELGEIRMIAWQETPKL
tara:strand:- start:283 stop:1269 length:987 start_codon:yes stop_codon:yes gene_type:complete